MNQQWLTILMSKGIELEQNLRQQLHTAKESIKSELEERGIKLNPTDLAALVEEVSPQASNAAVSYMLDILRPFSAGMGLRVAKLSDTQIEMVIPAKQRNMTENKRLHEAAMVTAAIEAAKLIWSRHAPLGELEMEVTRLESEWVKVTTEDCAIRLEMLEQSREEVLSQLRDTREAKAQNEATCFDKNDQVVATFRIELAFKHTPAISAGE